MRLGTNETKSIEGHRQVKTLDPSNTVVVTKLSLGSEVIKQIDLPQVVKFDIPVVKTIGKPLQGEFIDAPKQHTIGRGKVQKPTLQQPSISTIDEPVAQMIIEAPELTGQKIAKDKEVVTLKLASEPMVLDNYIDEAVNRKRQLDSGDSRRSTKRTRIEPKIAQRRKIDEVEDVIESGRLSTVKVRRGLDPESEQSAQKSIEEKTIEKTLGGHIAKKLIPPEKIVKKLIETKPKIEVVRAVVDQGLEITSVTDLIPVGVVRTIRDEAVRTVEYVGGKPKPLIFTDSTVERSESSNRKREKYKRILEEFAAEKRRTSERLAKGKEKTSSPDPAEKYFTFKASKDPESSKIKIEDDSREDRGTPIFSSILPKTDEQLNQEVYGMLSLTVNAAWALAAYKWGRGKVSAAFEIVTDSLKRGFSVQQAMKEAEAEAQRELHELGKREGIVNFYRGSKVVGATVGGHHPYNTRSGRGTKNHDRKRAWWENQPNEHGFDATDPDKEARLVRKMRRAK